MDHAATLAFAYNYQTIIEARRGDAAAALDAAERLAASHPGSAALITSWPQASHRVHVGARPVPRLAGQSGRASAEDLSDQKRRDSWIVLPFYFGLLGEIEAATGNLDGAFASIGAGLAIAEKTPSCIAFAATSC